MAGYYRKVFVFWGEGLNLSEEGVKVFDTDFGRIALLTCFDANSTKFGRRPSARGRRLVLWPSAYGGGIPLNGYAMIHNYYVVAVGRGNMIDIFGKTIENVEKPRKDQFIATLDLDVTIVHLDFTGEKVAKLLREHKGEVEQVPNIGDMESWYASGRQTGRARPRLVQTVPDRNPAGIPPPQPRANQPTAEEGREGLAVLQTYCQRPGIARHKFIGRRMAIASFSRG